MIRLVVFFTRAKKFFEIVNFYKNRSFSIVQRKSPEMRREFVSNVPMDTPDLEIEQQK